MKLKYLMLAAWLGATVWLMMRVFADILFFRTKHWWRRLLLCVVWPLALLSSEGREILFTEEFGDGEHQRPTVNRRTDGTATKGAGTDGTRQQ